MGKGKPCLCLLLHIFFIFLIESFGENPVDNLFSHPAFYCRSNTRTVNQTDKWCKNRFSENFNTLDPTKWKREIKFSLDTRDTEFVSYQNYAESCYVENGILYIKPKLLTDYPEFDQEHLRIGSLSFGSDCTGSLQKECLRSTGYHTILPPVVSCKITTKASFSFMYGKIEIRAKFPKGDWLFPELYLEPVDSFYGSPETFINGQMRIGFIRGNEDLQDENNMDIGGKILSGGVVLTQEKRFRKIWMKTIASPINEHWGDDFHIYSITWTEQEISVGVDNVNYATYKNFNRKRFIGSKSWAKQGQVAPFNREFYISLGVGAGGIIDFPENCINRNEPKPWNNTCPKAELLFWKAKNQWYPTWNPLDSAMQVDYIKVTSV